MRSGARADEFDVTPDGKAFLAIVPEQVGGELPLRFVLDFPAGTPRESHTEAKE